MKSNKKRVFFAIGIFFLFSILAFNIIMAINALGKNSLEKGKNQITINRTMYAKELLILNPEIESISYFDNFLNKSVGYVNVFGGIGSNFLIKPGKVYEISASKNISLIIDVKNG